MKQTADAKYWEPSPGALVPFWILRNHGFCHVGSRGRGHVRAELQVSSWLDEKSTLSALTLLVAEQDLCPQHSSSCAMTDASRRPWLVSFLGLLAHSWPS